MTTRTTFCACSDSCTNLPVMLRITVSTVIVSLLCCFQISTSGNVKPTAWLLTIFTFYECIPIYRCYKTILFSLCLGSSMRSFLRSSFRASLRASRRAYMRSSLPACVYPCMSTRVPLCVHPCVPPCERACLPQRNYSNHISAEYFTTHYHSKYYALLELIYFIY